MDRLIRKGDWFNGEYKVVIKYKDAWVDVSALSPALVETIVAWSNDSASKAYEEGLKEGAKIAKEVWEQKPNKKVKL